MKKKIAARAKKSAARAPATGAFGRTPTKRGEAGREFAQTSPAYIQPTLQEGNSAKRDVDSAIAPTLTTATRSAADFNLQLLEMARSNANSVFDFAHRLTGMQSPFGRLSHTCAQAVRKLQCANATDGNACAGRVGRRSRPLYDRRGKHICPGGSIRRAGLIARRRRVLVASFPRLQFAPCRDGARPESP